MLIEKQILQIPVFFAIATDHTHAKNIRDANSFR